MAQAIAMTGLPAPKVELAKRLGCPAFKRGSRVDCDELLAWVKDHPELDVAPEDSIDAVDIRLKIARAAKAEKETERAIFELGIIEKKYWLKDQVCSEIKQIAQTQRAILQRKLETELPPKLLGLDVISITEKMREVVDEICKILNDRSQQFQEQA